MIFLYTVAFQEVVKSQIKYDQNYASLASKDSHVKYVIAFQAV